MHSSKLRGLAPESYRSRGRQNDFIGVNSKGNVQDRRAMLADVKSDEDTYTSTKAEKLDLHLYGAGVTVVVGTANQKGTGKDGKAFDRTHRFTDTWMDRGGNCQS
jgi:hypothetical protein